MRNLSLVCLKRNNNIIKSCINYLVSFVNEITLINSIEDENIKQSKLNELVNSDNKDLL